MTLKGIGVVCALASEARHLGPRTRRLDGTRVSISGMGGLAATRAAQSLVEAGVGALVSWGMAGGLDPQLAAGAIFLPSEVLAPDGAAIATSAAWRARLGTALDAHHPIIAGRLLTAGKSIGTPDDKAALFRETQALAVDMESFAIASVAAQARLPFIAVRVIVDSAGDALPKIVTAAADSEGHLQVWSLMKALARAPGELPPLIRLARRYQMANRSLAAVARVGSLAPYPAGSERVS